MDANVRLTYLEYRVTELENLLAMADENLSAMYKEPGAIVHPYAYVASIERFRAARERAKT